jgi:ABC-type amino acid transport substrate-binding protein/signal transduction histidine kinase/CheY-like chemotaxis protein
LSKTIYLKRLNFFAEKAFSSRNQVWFAGARVVIILVFLLMAGVTASFAESNLPPLGNINPPLGNINPPVGNINTPPEIDSRVAVLENSKIGLTSEERAWIKAHPIIELGTDEGWAPYVVKQPDGTVAGFNIDLLNYINGQAGTNMQMPIGRWSEIVQKAKDREIDGLGTSTKSEERAEFFNFTDPYVSVFPVFVVSGSSKLEIDGIDDFRGKSVAILQSNRFHLNLLGKYPSIKIVEVPSELEAVKLTVEGKVDGAIVVTSIYNSFVKVFGNDIKVGWVATDNPLHILFSVRKDWPELVSIIDKVLRALPVETKNDMFFRWFGCNIEDLDGLSLRKKALLTEEERSWLKSHPKITLGAGSSFAPFIMTDGSGRPIGYDADIARLITERTGLKIDFEFGIWSDIQERAKKRDLDGLSTALQTKERSLFYNASKSYAEFASLIIVKRGNPAAIQTIDDIAGKRMGLQRGNASIELLDLKGKDVELFCFDGIDDVLKALVSEKVDFMLNDESIFYLARRLGLENLVEAAFTIGKMNSCHFLIRKDWPLATTIIDKGLASISQDERLEIRKGWFQVRAADSEERIILTTDEQAWIKEHREIILGARPARQPLEYVDQDGRHQGIVAEYVRILNNRLGLNMRIARNLKWVEVMNEGLNKGIDVLPGVTRTVEREKYLIFCEPYHYIDWVIISRIDTPPVNNLEDLKGRITAVDAEYASHQRISGKYPEIPLLPLPTTIEVLQSVIDGRADAAVVEMSSAILAIQAYRLQSLKIDHQVFEERDPLSLAVRKDWPELVQILNKGLHSITKEERRKISQKSLAAPIYVGFSRKEVLLIVLSVFGVMGVFLLFFLFSNRRLQRVVRERVKAEENLLEKTVLLEAQANATIDGILMVDTNLKRVLCNNRFKEFFNVPPEILADLDQMPLVKHVAGLTREPEKFYEKVLNIYEHPDEISHDEIEFTDGMICDRYTAPVLGDTGKLYGRIWSFHDITDRKRAEEERGKLEASVQRNQKLESLGVLAGGIAHDFNNLLGGIFGYIDMAIDETTDEEVSNYLKESMSNIDRARALTQQLLTFAKGGAPIRKVDNLFPFVQKTAEFALSGSSVSRSFHIQDNLWQCEFDKNQIGQVIDNLTINAIQAMPNGGIIEYTAQNVVIGLNDHLSLVPGNYVKFSIKDQGIGIPEDYLPRIFDPYYSTKSRGSGLGLSTSYSIVNRHDGCLDVESAPGKGTTFHVYLPASKESRPAVTEKSERSHEGRGIFLVMDDEAPIRKILKKMLESFGYTVVLKENGRDALDYIVAETNAKRSFSGMIFDLTIPGGMGGEEAIKEVRKICKETPVFVSSGYGGNSIMANPKEYGFTASLCKPFKKSELVEMLEEHLA